MDGKISKKADFEGLIVSIIPVTPEELRCLCIHSLSNTLHMGSFWALIYLLGDDNDGPERCHC